MTRPWVTAAAARMVEEMEARALITRRTGQVTDADGVVTDTTATVAVNCPIWVGSARPRRTDSMGDRFAEADHRLRFPPSVITGVQPGDVVTVTGAPGAPDLAEAVFDVVGTVTGSAEVSRYVWATRRTDDPQR